MNNYDISDHLIRAQTNIRIFRKAKSLKQVTIAKALEKSQNGFSKIELGYTELMVEDIIVIAMILNVSVEDLIFRDFKSTGALFGMVGDVDPPVSNKMALTSR